jgi:hypothetical protein
MLHADHAIMQIMQIVQPQSTIHNAQSVRADTVVQVQGLEARFHHFSSTLFQRATHSGRSGGRVPPGADVESGFIAVFEVADSLTTYYYDARIAC